MPKYYRIVLALIVFVMGSVLMPGLQARARFNVANSRFDLQTEELLLTNGYAANIIATSDGRRVLRASQRNYTTTTWARDLDYAIGGYSYILADMSVFRENIQFFLDATDSSGVVPENVDVVQQRSENRQAWDAMPNLISAAYTYAAKSGDRAFVAQNIATLERIAGWIERLDSSGDGLPDRDIFPYGYYDTVENSVMHTYALAKFYGAYRAMADLERWIGRDGERYNRMADKLRAGFHLPERAGGYWRADQAWPIAWRKADGRVFSFLETFGVLQASREGLIGPQDGWRYRNLFAALHQSRAQQIDPATPTKLTVGGYPLSIRRDVVPAANNWMLDAAAPWIVSLDVPERSRAGYAEDAGLVLDAYRAMTQRTQPAVLEFAASAGSRYGAGDSGDRGRTWDSAAWFEAVYGGHYGIRMTLDALHIAPQPLVSLNDDGITDLSYQGANVHIRLDAAQRSYRVTTDQPITVQLGPVGDGATIAVDGVERGPGARVQLGAGQSISVQSLGITRQRSDRAFAEVWQRADAPVQQGSASRSWLWGPIPFRTTVERYADSPGGERLVEYYDKSRMEITQPGGNRGERWFVTNGLLVKELVSGKLQVGDAAFEDRQPSSVAVAGDPDPSNPAPAYGAFGGVVSLNGDRRAEPRVGADVTATIDQAGQIGEDRSLARPETRISTYEANLGHNIPGVFWRYMTTLPDDWVFAFGYPISEPFWTVARVGGKHTSVLVQLFERRVLTYTPDNPRGFQVEMGNVGQHYHRWRYGFAPWEDWNQWLR
ncbi:MAG TPA: hypothetical protein VFZ66_07415 [Herpetosiphonaceae bacterium]